MAREHKRHERPMDYLQIKIDEAIAAIERRRVEHAIVPLVEAVKHLVKLLDGHTCMRCGLERSDHRERDATCRFFTPVKYPIEEQSYHD